MTNTSRHIHISKSNFVNGNGNVVTVIDQSTKTTTEAPKGKPAAPPSENRTKTWLTVLNAIYAGVTGLVLYLIKKFCQPNF